MLGAEELGFAGYFVAGVGFDVVAFDFGRGDAGFGRHCRVVGSGWLRGLRWSGELRGWIAFFEDWLFTTDIHYSLILGKRPHSGLNLLLLEYCITRQSCQAWYLIGFNLAQRVTTCTVTSQLL